MPIFKVWTRARERRVFVNIKEGENILQQLILQASKKLNITESKIVLDRDGTEIDEDEVLEVFCKEVLILLTSEESWQPDVISNLDLDSNFSSPKSLSSATTLTLTNLSDISENTNISAVSSSASATNAPLFLVVPPNGPIEDPLDRPVEDFNLPVEIYSQANLQDSLIPTKEPNECGKPTNEFTWTKFNIPWEKIPNYMLEACASSKADKAIITEMVHIIVNDIRGIKENIPYKAFRIVGRKLADKYPKTFLDYDEDGTVLGDGMHGIVSKIHIRNAYLNRPHKRPSQQDNLPVPLKKIKSIANLRAGCSNWQPQPESLDINDMKTALKHIDETDQNFYIYLEKTYANQRVFLNNVESPPGIANILAEWPIIVSNKNAIYWHFKKLTDIDFEEIQVNLLTKSQKIIMFGEKTLKTTIPNQGDEDVHKHAVKVLVQYFKEDDKALLIKIEDRNLIEDPSSLNIVQPTILELGAASEREYFVAMEGKIILHKKSLTTFLEALRIVFCLYFILNLLYPKTISLSLEMIQRYYLKHHPDYIMEQNQTTKKALPKKK